MSLESLVLESKNPLVNMIFSANDKASNGVNNKGKQAGKLTFISVGSKFRGQLAILLDKLKSTVSTNLLYTELVSRFLKISSSCQKSAFTFYRLFLENANFNCENNHLLPQNPFLKCTGNADITCEQALCNVINHWKFLFMKVYGYMKSK